MESSVVNLYLEIVVAVTNEPLSEHLQLQRSFSDNLKISILSSEKVHDSSGFISFLKKSFDISE